jgi:hypothetical protein
MSDNEVLTKAQTQPTLNWHAALTRFPFGMKPRRSLEGGVYAD